MRDSKSLRVVVVGTVATVTITVMGITGWRLLPVWKSYHEEWRVVRKLQSAPFSRGNWDYFDAVAEAESLSGGEFVLDALEAELRDPDKHHRLRAATALGRLGARKGIVPRGLIEALGDAESEVYQSVKNAFAVVGEPAVPPLCEILSSDLDPW
jgi:hypothetical protein